MSDTFHAVIETFKDGVNVILHKSQESAVKRFQAILEEVFMDASMIQEDHESTVAKALKTGFYGIGFGDIEQQQTLEMRVISVED